MKTTKFFLAALAMGAMIACSKSDDLQLSETQGTEMDALDVINAKAKITRPMQDTHCGAIGQFEIHTYVSPGSYRGPGSNLYAQVNFETRYGNKMVTVPLTTTGNDAANGGNSDYVAYVCMTPSLTADGWVKLKSASLFFEGKGLVKLHFLSIYMQAPEGNSRISGYTYLGPNNGGGLADLGSSGVASYHTGNIGEGTMTIHGIGLQQN